MTIRQREIFLLSVSQVCRRLPPILAPRVAMKLYPRRRAVADNHAFTVKSVTGSLFSGTTSDIYSYNMALCGYHEWRNLAIARSICFLGDVIFDVGANIGTETIGFADIVGPKGRVFAFEPWPQNVDKLRLNLTLNKHEHVQVFPIALSNRQETVLFKSPLPGNSGTGHVTDSPATASKNSVVTTILCETIDNIVGDLTTVTAIFIDAEGSEINILRGAEKCISTAKPILVVEAHPRHLQRYGFSLVDLYSELKRFGYAVLRISGTRGLIDVDLAANSGRNWIAIPAGQRETEESISRFIRRVGWSPFLLGLNPLSGGS